MKKITAIALLLISIMASCGDKNHIANKNRFIVYDIYIDDEMSCYRANRVNHDGWIDQRVIFKDTIGKFNVGDTLILVKKKEYDKIKQRLLQ